MFNFKTILLSGVLILLLTSVALQAYNIMYSTAKTNPVLFYAPPVINVVGMAVIGVLFVMG